MRSTLPKLDPDDICLKSEERRKCFKVKSVAGLGEILRGNPYSIVNVRHPFERLVSGKYLKIVNLFADTL